MKTLVVSYLPTGEQSNTKKLLESLLAKIPSKGSVEHLDLIENPPPFYDQRSIQTYYKRNYGGQELTAEEADLLHKQDRLIAQFKAADVVVLAYPMHNFSMPGLVKVWFDAVMANGQTFAMGPQGPVPVMKGKKALTLFTSGGEYPTDKMTPEYPNWDGVSTLTRVEFSFMGFSEIEVLGTSLRDATKAPEKLKAIDERLAEIVASWYA